MRNDSQATKEPRAQFRLLFNTVSRLNVLKLRRSVYFCSRGKHVICCGDILARLQGAKLQLLVSGSFGTTWLYFWFLCLQFYWDLWKQDTTHDIDKWQQHTEIKLNQHFESQKDRQRHFALISFMPWLSCVCAFALHLLCTKHQRCSID